MNTRFRDMTDDEALAQWRAFLGNLDPELVGEMMASLDKHPDMRRRTIGQERRMTFLQDNPDHELVVAYRAAADCTPEEKATWKALSDYIKSLLTPEADRAQ